MKLWAMTAMFVVSSNFFIFGYTGSANAEEVSNREIEEVIVTARKREERLQDIPGSAAALSESTIKDIGGISSLRDITDQIVGVTITESQSGELAEPSIRGAGQSRNRFSVSATGVYRNGAYFATTGLGGRSFARMDTFDVSRVEVLRGVQGALYGRNALGGAINVINRRPGDEFEVNLKAIVGENERQALEVIVNQPLNDEWAFRASYVTESQDDGFFEYQSGEALDTSDYDHLRLGLGWEPTENLSIYYSFDTEDEEYAPGILSRREHIATLGTDAFATLVNSEHTNDSEVDNHTFLVDWTLDKGTFSSVTNYRDRSLDNLSDLDYFAANLAVASNFRLSRLTENETDALFQEFRFVSALGGPLEYLVGVDYYTVDTQENADDTTGPQTLPTALTRFVTQTQDSWAIYGSLDYDFASLPLVLTAELRYAVDEIDTDVQQFRPVVSTVPDTNFSESEKFTNVPWGLTLAWHLDNGQVYGKVASAYRHGGFNALAGLPTDAFPVKLSFDEETSTTYEVGYKSSWLGNRLRFNVAAYFGVYEDFLNTTTNGCPGLCTLFDPITSLPLGFNPDGTRIETNAGGDPGIESGQVFFIDNIGETEVWGIEAELGFVLPVGDSGRLLGNLGWGRQQGEVTDISSSVSPANANLDGRDLPRLRDRQVKANLVYRQPLSLDSNLFRGAEMLLATTYTHEHGGFRDLNSLDPLDGVDRMDARFGIDAERWSLILNGSNILDKDYELFTFASAGGFLFRQNDPEYYWLELEVKF